jgi:UDP-3-O-[3-hydroxymyristoyl] glucosamine N-acyltransferase
VATLRDVANIVGGDLDGTDFVLRGVCSLDNLRSDCLGFANEATYEICLPADVRRVGILATRRQEPVAGVSLVRVTNPRRAFSKALNFLYPDERESGIHPTAIIHPSVVVGSNCTIGAYSVVEKDVVIGSNVIVGHHVVISARTQIGESTRIMPQTVIGGPGFGFEADGVGGFERIPHIGGVRIGANVEIGSCVVIARGTIDETVIENGVKVDDHVFIAHNVRIGRNSLVIAGAQVSGSVKIGENCWVAPQASIINGVSVGARSTIGIGAVVIRDVLADTVVYGNPARVRDHKLDSEHS